jgi:Flp pilus assembly protein TadD
VVAADAFGFYIAKIFAPIHFSADYARTPKLLLAGLWKQMFWLAVPVILGVFILCRNRFVRMMIAWFVIALLPVLGLIPFDYQAISTVADRYAYLAMIAIAAFVAAALMRFPRAVPVALTLIAVLAIESFHLAGFWKNDVTLFTHALEVNLSSALACNNLGYEFQLQGKTADAIDLYRRSIALREDNPVAWTNLGYIFSDSPGSATQAQQCFERAIALNPKSERAHNGLGILLARAGDLENARQHFTAAVELEPRDPDPLNNLAVSYLDADPSRAIEILSQVLSTHPDNINALHNKGLARRRMGDDQQACDSWRRALSVDPNYSPSLLELGNTLLHDGQTAEAESCFRKLIQIDPSSAVAHNNLGLILIQQHQIESAAEEFAKAAALRPDRVDVQRNLAGARLLLKLQSSSAPTSAPSP